MIRFLARISFMVILAVGFAAPTVQAQTAWAPSGDDYSGLEVEQGSPFPGRPATVVTGVAPGSPAERAGLTVGQEFIPLSPYTTGPMAVMKLINDRLKDGKPYELMLLSDRGFEQGRIFLRPAVLPQANTTVPSIGDFAETLLTNPEDRGLLERYFNAGRLDPNRPAVPQMVEIAAALGVAQNQITSAIETGRLALHEDDLLRVYLEPEGASCQALMDAEMAQFSQLKNISQESIDTRRAMMKNNMAQACDSIWRLWLDRDRIDAWNATYGPVSDAFNAASFRTARQTETITAVSASITTGAKLKRYRQRRCDFTHRMGNLLPAVAVDCNGVVPVEQNIAVNKQLIAAQRTDVFGGPGDGIGYRLRLLADGSFDAFDNIHLRYHRTDAQKDAAVLNGMRLIAGYGIARGEILGACGSQMHSWQVTQRWTTGLRTVSGIQITSRDWQRTTTFSIPVYLLPARERSRAVGSPGPLGMSTEMRRILSALSCDHPMREKLEVNMVAYLRQRL
ncbi:MAG: hypothetical protein AAF631_04970 [Pseudomonadota bacterium]